MPGSLRSANSSVYASSAKSGAPPLQQPCAPAAPPNALQPCPPLSAGQHLETPPAKEYRESAALLQELRVVVGRANTLPSWEFAVRGAVVDRDGTSPLLKTVEIGHSKGGAGGAVTSAEGGPNDDDGDDATCPFRVERGHGRGSGGCGSDFFGVRDGTFVGDGSRW